MKKRVTRKPLSTKPRLPARAKVSAFARQLLREWRRLELPEQATIVVAVSGGADSVALLLAIDELVKSKKVSLVAIVAHLNHQLRGEASNADARWVASLAKRLRCRSVQASVDVEKRAATSGDNLEQAARRARYDFLKRVANKNRAAVILTGHTIDDQAETVLLNLLRGSGADGLGGIEPVRPLEPGGEFILARPLVTWATHADTENYCRQRSIDFRTDEMNVDESFARVRVRRQLLPLMKSFNPKIVESLARSAEILRNESDALDGAARRLVEFAGDTKSHSKKAPESLRIDLLQLAQPALRHRALRLWIMEHRENLRRLERVHIAAIDSLIFSRKSGRLVELPGGGKIARTSGRLHYLRNKSSSPRTSR